MIIWIDDDVAQLDFAASLVACVGVEALFTAAFRGEHYVFARRAVLQKLYAVKEFGAPTRNTIKKIQGDITQSDELISKVGSLVTITRDGQIGREVNGKGWRIPLQVVGERGLRPVALLAEHIDDARLYVHAGRHYGIHASLGKCRMVVEPRGGGGSGIVGEFEAVARDRKQFCLCVTDGDRLSEHDGESSPSRKCAALTSDFWVAGHMSLKKREIENLVPIELMEELLDPAQGEEWARLMKIGATCQGDVLAYCDLKNGTKLVDVLEIPVGSPSRTFWDAEVKLLSDKGLIALRCGLGGCESPKACTCVVTPGFGKRLIPKANIRLDEDSPHATFRKIKNGQRTPRWLEVGQCVLQWCCAPAPTRS